MGPIKRRICHCLLHLSQDDEVAPGHGLILDRETQEAKVAHLKADLVRVNREMFLMIHVSTTQMMQEAHRNQEHRAAVVKREEVLTWMMSNVHLTAHVLNQKGGQPLIAKDEQQRKAPQVLHLEIYFTETKAHPHIPFQGATSKLIMRPTTLMMQPLSPQSAITNVLIVARDLPRAHALTKNQPENQESILALTGVKMTT